MKDEKADKVYVHTGQKVAQTKFSNYSSAHIQNPVIKKEARGILLIFNCLEKLLRVPNSHDAKREKMIEGLSNEISHSLTSGWDNYYYCSFDKYSDFSKVDLPDDFSLLDDDMLFSSSQTEEMYSDINDNLPHLKTVRVVGVVSKKEVELLAESIDDSVKIELESPFLVVV